MLETDESHAVGTLRVTVRALEAMLALLQRAAAATAAAPPPPKGGAAARKVVDETHFQEDMADDELDWDIDVDG